VLLQPAALSNQSKHAIVSKEGMQVIGSQKGIITLSRRDEAYASRYKARKRKPSGFFTKQNKEEILWKV